MLFWHCVPDMMKLSFLIIAQGKSVFTAVLHCTCTFLNHQLCTSDGRHEEIFACKPYKSGWNSLNQFVNTGKEEIMQFHILKQHVESFCSKMIKKMIKKNTKCKAHVNADFFFFFKKALSRALLHSNGGSEFKVSVCISYVLSSAGLL